MWWNSIAVLKLILNALSLNLTDDVYKQINVYNYYYVYFRQHIMLDHEFLNATIFVVANV